MKVCDINLNDTVTIVLTGKGGKSRIVPVMKPTGELLRQYIEGNGLSHPARSRTPLFTNRGNHPLTRAGVNYILKKYAAQAQAIGVKDISEKIAPHWLRHSKAMHLLQSGLNLIYIRDLLGHSDVMQTVIPFSVKIQEANSEGISIFRYAPKCKAADHLALGIVIVHEPPDMPQSKEERMPLKNSTVLLSAR